MFVESALKCAKVPKVLKVLRFERNLKDRNKKSINRENEFYFSHFS